MFSRDTRTSYHSLFIIDFAQLRQVPLKMLMYSAADMIVFDGDFSLVKCSI